MLLSSMMGIIGSGGQANYAAECSYQDELAGERRTAQPEVGLDLIIIDSRAIRF